MRLRSIVLATAGVLVVAASATAALTGATALPAGNLVKNPGGEVPLGGGNGVVNVAPVAWLKEDVKGSDGRVQAGVQVVRYVKHEANGILGTARSASIGGGRNYFSGGYPASISTAYQVLDVSGAAAEIDGGGVKACLSAYLGGSAFSPATASSTPNVASWRCTVSVNACSIRLAVKKLVMIRCVIGIGWVGTPNGCGLSPKSIISSSGVPVTRQKFA